MIVFDRVSPAILPWNAPALENLCTSMNHDLMPSATMARCKSCYG